MSFGGLEQAGGPVHLGKASAKSASRPAARQLLNVVYYGLRDGQIRMY